MDERSYIAFQDQVLTTVHARADELTARWTAQIRNVALMDETQLRNSSDVNWARRFAETLLISTETDENDDAIAIGLTFGGKAFVNGSSLHHTMKALELLSAIVLYAVETSIEQSSHFSNSAGAAHGIKLARHLQRRSALLSLATTRGYMQAYTEALKERFRHLRHDLRNPLGTIKSVLSLMDDESVPLDARADPRFQAIAKRNARSLEDLIADRLSDAAALLPIIANQQISLRTIACSVRRELRSEIEQRGLTILVATVAPYGQVDVPGLELVLRAVLQAIIHECVVGDELQLTFSGPTDGQALVSISCESGRELISDGATREQLALLSRRISATLTTGRSIVLAIPMTSEAGEPTGAIDGDYEERRVAVHPSVILGDRNPGDDIGSSRQRHHG